MTGLEFAARVTGVIILTPFILASKAAEKIGNFVAEAMLICDDIDWDWSDEDGLD